MKEKITLESSWLDALKHEFESDYMRNLKLFLLEEKNAGKTIYPSGNLIFNALNTTPLNGVKIVILGQDPYHNPNQAHGLSFSVQHGIKPPPSLVNIYKEIQSDLGYPIPNHGNLTHWAEQGVLLLNAILTVRANEPASHRNKGWEIFTDKIIQTVNEKCENVAFLLWGAFAHKKEDMIDSNRHLVLKAPHPSPYSASSGFFGCKHFSKANEYLKKHNKTTINWEIR